jgi:hypothetical protein
VGDSEDDATRRRPWSRGPDPPPGRPGWLGLTDDELLYRIEALSGAHTEDASLVEVVRSSRHFFIRQEAAKKIRDRELLKEHSQDRHIGQILVRAMTRKEDVAYLEKLIRESRHVEVKKAAEAQLRVIASEQEGRGTD